MDIKKAVTFIEDPDVLSYFKKLFETIPSNLLSHFSMISMESDEYIIYAGDPCNTVYILLKGTVRLSYELPAGVAYTFATSKSPAFFGEMETFSDFPFYRAFVICDTPCTYIAVSKRVFLAWMHSSNDALFMLITLITQKIARQSSRDRTFLFSRGESRLIYSLIQYYENHAVHGLCQLNVLREQLADEICLSVKTVNRSIRKFKDQALISQKGRTLIITPSQYQALVAKLQEEEINLVPIET